MKRIGRSTFSESACVLCTFTAINLPCIKIYKSLLDVPNTLVQGINFSWVHNQADYGIRGVYGIFWFNFQITGFGNKTF